MEGDGGDVVRIAYRPGGAGVGYDARGVMWDMQYFLEMAGVEGAFNG